VSLAPVRRGLEELFLEWSNAGEVQASAAISRAEQAVEGERHSR